MAHSRGVRSRRQFSSSLRRATSWSLGPRGIVSTAIAAQLVFPSTAVADDDGLTLIRTRGELLVKLSTSDAATSGMAVNFGICIVSQNAAGVGVTAIPDPDADISWDGWLVYWTGTVKGALSSNEGSSTHRLVLDSKAMRKIKRTDVVVAVLSTDDEIGSVTLNADLETRLLLKLP